VDAPREACGRDDEALAIKPTLATADDDVAATDVLEKHRR
jgi:hypothetical protein